MLVVRDIQQVYEMWLRLTTQKRQSEAALTSPTISEEKNIAMPTDYAEPMVGSRFNRNCAS